MSDFFSKGSSHDSGSDDDFEGGIGDDTYNWGLNSSFSVIEDRGGNDTLNIDAASTDVTFSAVANSSAIQLSLSGRTLTIKDYLHTSGLIETIAFSNGIVWRLEDVRKAIPGLPPLTDGHGDDDNPHPGKHIKGGSHHDHLTGSADDDSLDGGRGHDTLQGGDGQDTLVGGIGNNWLSGGAGDDVLIGGTGKDTLTGGDGQDIFRFSGRSDTGSHGKIDRDVIVDFVSGTDLIDLSGIDANTRTKDDDAFTKLLSGKGPFKNPGELRYDAKTGILYGNTDKDAAAEFQIQLKHKPASLDLSDFIL